MWESLDAFLRSDAFLSAWQRFWMVLSWISIPVTLFLIWPLLISPGRKLTKRIKQIERDIHSPGMEDVRHFLKPLLKKLGIKVDDKHHERN